MLVSATVLLLGLAVWGDGAAELPKGRRPTTVCPSEATVETALFAVLVASSTVVCATSVTLWTTDGVSDPAVSDSVVEASVLLFAPAAELGAAAAVPVAGVWGLFSVELAGLEASLAGTCCGVEELAGLEADSAIEGCDVELASDATTGAAAVSGVPASSCRGSSGSANDTSRSRFCRLRKSIASVI